MFTHGDNLTVLILCLSSSLLPPHERTRMRTHAHAHTHTHTQHYTHTHIQMWTSVSVTNTTASPASSASTLRGLSRASALTVTARSGRSASVRPPPLLPPHRATQPENPSAGFEVLHPAAILAPSWLHLGSVLVLSACWVGGSEPGTISRPYYNLRW